ncbi:MAG: OmpH family outer membrane protein [Paludibacteraceae bacterium]|nr:OmpH family outer membrane protein [Paludibacteraceae bacterium]
MKKIILFSFMLLLMSCATKKRAIDIPIVAPQDTIKPTIIDRKTDEVREKSDTTTLVPQVSPTPQIQVSEPKNNLPKMDVSAIAGKHIYGHINVGDVVMQLPEYKQVIHKMDSLQLYLADQYKAMQVEYQTKQQELESDTTMLPMVREMKQAELQSLLDRIKYFLSYSEQQLVEERNRLLSPIYQKIQTVIKETGDELKLLYVFDNSYLLASSANSLDITPIIINKMLQK